MASSRPGERMSVANLALLGGSLAVGAFISGGFLPTRGLHDWLVPGAMWRSPDSAVALTFDDGPHPEQTPRVLELLSSFGVVATFFVVGQKAARHPDIVRRIAREGHAIGNHGWSHRSLNLLRRASIDDEIVRCQDAIATITGRAPRTIRPPYGRRDFRTNLAFRRHGLQPVLWSVDSHDWLHGDRVRVDRRLSTVGAGDIVLLHDGLDGARCPCTVESTARLLRRLARSGLRCGALS